MHAIAGLWSFAGPLRPASVQALRAGLARYGADGEGLWQAPGIALLRSLNRVTADDAFDAGIEGAAQDRQLLLFSGRLYHREELADALGLPRAELVRSADSHLAQRAWARWGSEATRRLQGDYAIAVWEPGARRLTLLRDPLGARPLYWCHTPQGFAFASSAWLLHALPEVPGGFDEGYFADVLALLSPRDARTAYRHIRRLRPGEALCCEDGRLRRWQHYRYEGRATLRLKDDGEYAEAFRAEFGRAVQARLRSTTPLGAELSSGFDSSTVSVVAAEALAARGQPLTCFTAAPRPGSDPQAPPEFRADESAIAAITARRFANIEHCRVVPPAGGAYAALEQLLPVYGRPHRNPCNLDWPVAIYAEAQRRGIRVLLSGRGGNLTLSYTGGAFLSALFAAGDWAGWWRELRRLRRQQGRSAASLAVQSLGHRLPRAVVYRLSALRAASVDLNGAALPAAVAARHRLAERLAARGREGYALSERQARLRRYAMLANIGIGEFNVPAAAALAGIEVRDPTADLRFAEFSLSLPERQFRRDGRTRWILRQAYGHLLPPEVTEQPGFGYQGADWYDSACLDLPRYAALLPALAASPAASQLLDLERLRTELAAWPADAVAAQAGADRFRGHLLRGLAAGRFLLDAEAQRAGLSAD